MKKERKEKDFIQLPQYQGGKKAYIEFIRQNLRYPKEALEAKIEGRVLVEYEIDDNGTVHNPRVKKSLGYGCDEEAMRVVSLLRYEKVKNRGLRVRAKNKTFINFKLPQTQASISYTVTPSKKTTPTPPKPDAGQTYGYTITIN
jgi:TonB family protein